MGWYDDRELVANGKELVLLLFFIKPVLLPIDT